MARSKHEWAQFELKAAPGAELWVIVRHRGGWFRLPADAAISELLRGVHEGWDEKRRAARASGFITLPVSEYYALVSEARSAGAGSS